VQRTEEEMATSVHREQMAGKSVPVEVLVRDGRKKAKELRLDTHSFQFERGVPTALTTEEFYSDQGKVDTSMSRLSL
jgi:hypothetical protein